MVNIMIRVVNREYYSNVNGSAPESRENFIGYAGECERIPHFVRDDAVVNTKLGSFIKKATGRHSSIWVMVDVL